MFFFFLKNQTLKIIFNWKNKYSIQRTTFENQQFSHLQELFYLWEPFSFELDNWWIDHGTTKVNNACSRTAILFLWNSSSSCSPPCKILHVSVLLAPLYLSSTWHCQFLFFWEHWAMIRTLLISTPYAVICHDSGFKNFAKVHNSKQCHGRWTVSLVLAHMLSPCAHRPKPWIYSAQDRSISGPSLGGGPWLKNKKAVWYVNSDWTLTSPPSWTIPLHMLV